MSEIDRSKRFRQMICQSKTEGKYSPSFDELVDLFFTTVRDMKCPVCNREMHWSGNDGMDGVITIQHDREKPQIRLICGACNSHHKNLPGDMFYRIPPGHKYCPKCKEIKNWSCFSKDRAKVSGLKSWCRECSTIGWRKWYKNNSDHQRSNIP